MVIKFPFTNFLSFFFFFWKLRYLLMQKSVDLLPIFFFHNQTWVQRAKAAVREIRKAHVRKLENPAPRVFHDWKGVVWVKVFWSELKGTRINTRHKSGALSCCRYNIFEKWKTHFWPEIQRISLDRSMH